MADKKTSLSKNPHETWRDAMSPEELAAFDAGRYNHRATAPVFSRGL
jgi:hypothetical protein